MNLPSPLDCCEAACPATAVAIPGPIGPSGPPGAPCVPCSDGVSAFTTTTSSTTMPAVSATVIIAVVTSAPFVIGENIFVQFLGYMLITAIGDSTHITAQNLGYPENAAPATVAGIGARVAPSGSRGAVGSAGAGGATGAAGPAGSAGGTGATGSAGKNAYTALTSNFTMPAIATSDTAVVGNSDWATIGQVVFLQGAGTLQVTAKPSSTQVTLLNPAAYTANVAGGTVIASPATISPSGLIGPSVNAIQFQCAINAAASAFGGGWGAVVGADTLPTNANGTEILTVAITPVNASSKLIIEAIVPITVGNAAVQVVTLALFKDAVVNALAASAMTLALNGYPGQIALTYEEAAGSTSARTYKIRVGTSDGNPMGVNGSPAGARTLGGGSRILLKVTEFPP